jgi:SAM-dependent methyltransferase
MTKTIKRLLGLRGLHFFATRFGTKRLKSLAFDEKFRNGDWQFGEDSSGELARVVSNYANQGDLLIMGCGGAAILQHLESGRLASVLGIDIAKEAIRLASRYQAPNIAFQESDMIRFKCPRLYNLILFSESLNYVPFFKRKSYLQELCKALKPDGCIVITIAQSRRYSGILSMIRRSFQVLEDRKFSGSERHLIIIRARGRD